MRFILVLSVYRYGFFREGVLSNLLDMGDCLDFLLLQKIEKRERGSK